MAAIEQPLDQISWRSNDYLLQNGLHDNSVLFYFMDSPFFEGSSNNAVVFTQALAAADHATYGTRKAFESVLDKMSGLEFRVLQTPAETGYLTGTGVWVIGKQTRQKDYSAPNAPDQITLHATYFIVEETIYMAPTVADVINSRMVSWQGEKGYMAFTDAA
jgi:mediator of RNA polymerase II transcription subunit 6